MAASVRVLGLALAAASKLAGGAHIRLQPLQVGARIMGDDEAVVPYSSSRTRKYLLGSFPRLQQVAYVHLPDNVWRPLVVGELASPGAVTVDTQKSRLFVADPPNKVIWWYQLQDRPDGFLETTGTRKAAVEGFVAMWMDVNTNGDLYFTGHAAGEGNKTDSVFRQDALHIAYGASMSPTEVFSRANTGSPDPQAWKPTGVTTDSFCIYWGNQADGQTHGTIVKGSRDNIGSTTKDMFVSTLNDALDGATGLVSTGTHLFWLSPLGVFGAPKNSETKVSDPLQGYIAPPPTGSGGVATWSPQAIEWDGDNTLYLTDAAAGVIYSLPSLNVREHNITKFTDAPGVSDIAMVAFQGFSKSGAPRSTAGFFLLLLAAAGSTAIAAVRP